jgi:cell division septation protein DedD
MVEERRQHTRLVPGSPLFVSLDYSKSGLLLDVCEGGVAVASLVPRNLDEVISLAFDLPEGQGHVEGKAEIAWTRDAGHLTGVRFVDLDDSSRQKLGEWICSRASQALPRNEESVQPVFVTRSTYAQVEAASQENRKNGTAEASTSPAPPLAAGEGAVKQAQILTEIGLSGGGKSRHTIELILAVVLLSWALVFLGYQMGSTGFSRAGREIPSGSKGAEAPSQAMVGSVEASPAPSQLLSGIPSVSDAGVVLQVGAMKLEENADAMAQELQKKNFPAFVFRHGGDRLYKVAVGPYGDTDATTPVKDKLEKEGFQPILKRWLPE